MKVIKIIRLTILPSIALVVFSLLLSMKGSDELYNGTGTISFTSDAPLELITASSNEIKGIIKITDKTFAFSLPVRSFEGFNSPLQKEHFNEHYLETKKFPKATFTGKILNFDDCEIGCEKEIIAKGKLSIHGITQIVTLPINLEITEDGFLINGDFDVLLSDYNIEIPLILEGKISTKIAVTIDLIFKKQP